jgi:hypothetical protein
MTKVQIDIPKEHHRRVKAGAAYTGQTIAQFCSEASVTYADQVMKQASEEHPSPAPAPPDGD